MDEYSFLSWLEPFVQLRATVSNVPNASRDRALEQEDEDESSSESFKDDDSEIENISEHHGDADSSEFNSTRNNLDVTMEINEHDGVLHGEEDDELFDSHIVDVSQHCITKRDASSKYPKKPKEPEPKLK